MEIKLDLNTPQANAHVEAALRQTILAGAVNHLVSQLTHDRLQAFMFDMLGTALKDVVTGYNVRRLLEEHTKPLIESLLAQPDVQVRIQEAVTEGVNSAIAGIPEHINRMVLGRLSESALLPKSR